MIKQGGRGKAFEALIIYSFNSSTDSYAIRLREGIKGAFCVGCKRYINLSHMSRQQPFDYVVGHRGRPFAIEAKSVHGVSFPFRNIKDHQIHELDKFDSQGSAHVLLEFIPGKGRPKRYFLIPIAKFKSFMDFYSLPDNKRESLPMEAVTDCLEDKSVLEVNLGKNDSKKPVLVLTPVLDQMVERRWSN